MKDFFVSFFGALAAILVLLALTIGVGSCVMDDTPDVPKGGWLVIELFGDVLEYDPPGGILSQIQGGGGGETLQNILDNLAKAEVDKRIEGVIFKVGAGASMGAATIEEVHGAIDRVRAAGKPVHAWAESFDAPDYYLLAACDTIWAPPTAYIGFTGFTYGSMHLRNALDKLGIEAQLHKIKDYKSAAEMMLRADASAPAKENDLWLLEERWDLFTSFLGERRGLDVAAIEGLMEHAMFQAEEALEGGLIDEMKYWDEVEAELRGDDDELLTISSAEYAKISPEDVGLGGKSRIAVVHAQGTITGRANSVHPLFGVTMGHETIVAALRAARLDDDVSAVILRVDSPGGEALASDLMGHEVELTKAVKPVVVSMVDVAASGGYHIAYRADRILAGRGTVTGSIGSISGKFNMAGFFDQLGVSFDHVAKGPNARINTDQAPYTPEQWERFKDDHWKGFNHWLTDVAEHRGMSFEQAESLAHGRVWTGRQAEANGLVDEIGDLHRAVEVAKELAEIDADAKVTLVHYPKAVGLLESLTGGGDAAIGDAARLLVHRELKEEARRTRALLEQYAAGTVVQVAP